MPDGGSSHDSSGRAVIRTSSKGWFAELATAYRLHTPVVTIDDVSVGIDPLQQTLLDIGKKAGLSPQEWVGAGVALGLAVTGAWLIVLALGDPEPTTKLWLLVAAGAVGFLGGGFKAVSILTETKPPKIAVRPYGFEIDWN